MTVVPGVNLIKGGLNRIYTSPPQASAEFEQLTENWPEIPDLFEVAGARFTGDMATVQDIVQFVTGKLGELGELESTL